MNTNVTDSPSGVQYALRIFMGSAIVWFGLRSFSSVNPLWAVIPVIVVSEPQFQGAVSAFKSRLLNTLVGCGVALAFLAFFGFGSWSVLVAIAVSVLVGSYLVGAHVSWKVAPVTVAIIMVPGITEGSRRLALNAAFWRTAEVLLGGGVAVGVAWAITEISRWHASHRHSQDKSVSAPWLCGGRANENKAAQGREITKSEAQGAGGADR